MLKRKKKLYIRIAKTGSTSLSTAFDKSVIEVTPSIKYEKKYKKYEYDYRFTFIRNPYDRIVSAYLMNTKSKLSADYYMAINKKEILNIPFNDYIKKVLYFRSIYQELGLKKKNNIHLRPWRSKKQINKNRLGFEAYWLLAHTEGMIDTIEYFTPLSTLDFIGKYESLNNDYIRLGKHVDLKEELGHFNASSNRKKYNDYYDDESLELVTHMYKKDIETFNYTFDNSE